MGYVIGCDVVVVWCVWLFECGFWVGGMVRRMYVVGGVCSWVWVSVIVCVCVGCWVFVVIVLVYGGLSMID